MFKGPDLLLSILSEFVQDPRLKCFRRVLRVIERLLEISLTEVALTMFGYRITVSCFSFDGLLADNDLIIFKQQCAGGDLDPSAFAKVWGFPWSSNMATAE